MLHNTLFRNKNMYNEIIIINNHQGVDKWKIQASDFWESREKDDDNFQVTGDNYEDGLEVKSLWTGGRITDVLKDAHTWGPSENSWETCLRKD